MSNGNRKDTFAEQFKAAMSGAPDPRKVPRKVPREIPRRDTARARTWIRRALTAAAHRPPRAPGRANT